MRNLFLSAALVCLSAVAANAVWIHTKTEDPFQGDTHLAFAGGSSGYGVGFRCQAGPETNLTIIFTTPERMSTDNAAVLGSMPVSLLVIADDQPKVTLEGKADTAGDENNLRIYSEEPQVGQLVKAALAARRRFAIAAEMVGKIVHSHSFDLSGSTKAITELMQACKLQ